MNEVAINCSALCKSFGEGATKMLALRSVDLQIYKGEMLMIAGPSGCGKTTLLSIISGILKQDEGQLTIYSQDLKSLTDNDLISFRGKNMGFVFQGVNLIPALTIAENIAMPLLIQGFPYKQSLERAHAMLMRLGLNKRDNTYPNQISGGQQQRVAIGRALIHDPPLIICDEPTSALDQVSGLRIMTLFREVALTSERTIIIVTHDKRIYKFADRIAKMNDGKVEAITKPEDEA